MTPFSFRTKASLLFTRLFRTLEVSLRRLLDRLDLHIKRTYDYLIPDPSRFYILASVLYLAFYPIELAFSDPTFDTLSLRILFSLVSLTAGLYFRTHKGNSLNPYINICALTFLIPFAFSSMFVLNAATSLSASEVHFGYPASFLSMLFVSVILMNSYQLSLLTSLIGASASLLLVNLVEEPNWKAINEIYLNTSGVWLAAIVVGSWTNRNTEIATYEKAVSAEAVGLAIADHLRQPLRDIETHCELAKPSFASLSEYYEASRGLRPSNQGVPERQYSIWASSLDDLLSETEYAHSVVRMLSVSTTSSDIDTESREEFHSVQFVKDVIRRYPFSGDRERSLIRIGGQFDFRFYAPPIAISHVLFNLLKNALYYVQSAKEREAGIEISILPPSKDGESGQITVTDTGPGIPAEHLSKIFDRFYTTTPAGSGIGLSYSQTVMNGLGGSIRCTSVPNSYTTFTLTFPGAAI